MDFQKGSLEVVCGPMFSGKSEELIRRIKRVQISGKNFILFKPFLDDRYSTRNIVSHDKRSLEAIATGGDKEAIANTLRRILERPVADRHACGMRSDANTPHLLAGVGPVLIHRRVCPTGDVVGIAVRMKQDLIWPAATFETIDHSARLWIDDDDLVVKKIGRVNQPPGGRDGDVADEIGRSRGNA